MAARRFSSPRRRSSSHGGNHADAAISRMALGFYRADRNGHIVLDHGGDTELFHSDLHLSLDDGVGLFISTKAWAQTAPPRECACCCSGSSQTVISPPPRRRHCRRLRVRRGMPPSSPEPIGQPPLCSNFLLIASLAGQVSIKALPDGTLETPRIQSPGPTSSAGAKWGHNYGRIGGRTLLKAVLKDGRVDHFTLDEISAIEVLQPVRSPSMRCGTCRSFTHRPRCCGRCSVGRSPLIRRRYQRPFPLSGRAALLHRVVRVTARRSIVAGRVDDPPSLPREPHQSAQRSAKSLAAPTAVTRRARPAGRIGRHGGHRRGRRDTTRSRWAKLVAVLLALAYLDGVADPAAATRWPVGQLPTQL